ncbi:MAG: hypothetical protein AAFQ98_26715, partial [Bacteroidota bacterium]
WNPARWLTVNSGPNFALANEERELEMGLYLETECNWRLTEWFHLGPVVGWVFGEHSELNTGIQVGFEF